MVESIQSSAAVDVVQVAVIAARQAREEGGLDQLVDCLRVALMVAPRLTHALSDLVVAAVSSHDCPAVTELRVNAIHTPSLNCASGLPAAAALCSASSCFSSSRSCSGKLSAMAHAVSGSSRTLGCERYSSPVATWRGKPSPPTK